LEDGLETTEQAVEGFTVYGLEQMKMNTGFWGTAAVLVPARPGDGDKEGQLVRFLLLEPPGDLVAV
jgi:hypothetical protein